MIMKSLFGKAWIGLALLAALAATGCNRGATNVAVVNGEPITEEEFYSYLKVKPEVQITLPNGETANARVAQSLGFQALQDLVRQRVIVQLAKDMKVEPTEKQVTDEVEFQRKRDGNFVKNLMEQGLTLDQIKESLKVDLAREALLTRGITITTDEVEKYIKDNPRQFEEPELVDALWIFVRDERGRRDVDRALVGGDGFNTVAIRFSQAPGVKEQGGRFPQRVVEAIPSREVQQILRQTPEGKETDWIRLQDGWAKFKVEDKTAAKKMEITDVDRQWIKRQLAVRQGILANDLDKRLVRKLSDSKIDISVREYKGPWETLIEQMEKSTEAEKSTTPQSPTQEGSPTQQGGNRN